MDIPPKADFPYKGSNAEFIVLKKDGDLCSFKEYQNQTLPILSQKFPRPENVSVDDELYNDEAAWVESKLEEADLVPIKIPKSLYDLFYWRFHYEDRINSHFKDDESDNIMKANEGKPFQKVLKKLQRVNLPIKLTLMASP